MTVAQYKKSAAGELAVGTIDDITNGVSVVIHWCQSFMSHFLRLDQYVLKKLSKVIKISRTFC
jgi:hypothetical protein